MKENNENLQHSFKTNFAKLDAHIVTQEELDEIPELTEDFFIHADFYHGEKLIRRGRPRKAEPKIHLNFRVDADIVHALKAHGKGWQTLANQALREWIEKHP